MYSQLEGSIWIVWETMTYRFIKKVITGIEMDTNDNGGNSEHTA